MSKKNKIFEFGMLLGDSCWKIAEIKQTKEGKEIYFILPIPKLGLHLAFHESGEMHIRDNLGFDEPIEIKKLAKLYNSQREIISDLSPLLYHPEYNSEIVVVPASFEYSNPENYGLYGLTLPKKKVHIDLLRLFSSVSFLEPRVCNTLLRPQKTAGPCVAFDLVENKAILPWAKLGYLDLDVDLGSFLKRFFQTNFGKLVIKPIWKYFEEQLTIIEKWVPKIPGSFKFDFEKIIESKGRDLEKTLQSLLK